MANTAAQEKVHNAQEKLEKIAASVKAAAGDEHLNEAIAQRVHETIDRLSQTVAEAEKRFRGLTENVEQRMLEQVHSLDFDPQETAGGVRGYVKRHPLASLGIALTAGFVVGAIVRRR